MNLHGAVTGAERAEQDPRPTVAMPSQGLPRGLLFGLIAVLALALFLYINGRRTKSATNDSAVTGTAGTIAAPPPLAVPQAAPVYYEQPRQYSPRSPLYVPPAYPQTVVVREPASTNRVAPMVAPIAPPMPTYAVDPAPPPLPATENYQPIPSSPSPRRIASAIVLDRAGSTTWSGPRSIISGGPSNQQLGPDGQPIGRKIARPEAMSNPSTVIVTGSVMEAVLETPIDTARGGTARAIIAKDVRGYDGSRVLVPRGSRLMGKIDGGADGGRAIVTWTEMLLPDGRSLLIDSPASGPDGQSGIPGKSHGGGIGRFLGGALQTAMTVGASVLGGGRSNAVIVGLPGAVPQIASGSTQRNRRVTVPAGTKVSIFVAQRLDFAGSDGSGG